MMSSRETSNTCTIVPLFVTVWSDSTFSFFFFQLLNRYLLNVQSVLGIVFHPKDEIYGSQPQELHRLVRKATCKCMDFTTEQQELQVRDEQRTSGSHRIGLSPSLMHLVSTLTIYSLLTVKLKNVHDKLALFQNWANEKNTGLQVRSECPLLKQKAGIRRQTILSWSM